MSTDNQMMRRNPKNKEIDFAHTHSGIHAENHECGFFQCVPSPQPEPNLMKALDSIAKLDEQPEPEVGLLTDDQLKVILAKNKNHNIQLNDLRIIAETQRKLTSTLLNAEWQKRVDEMGKIKVCTSLGEIPISDLYEYQALKSKYQEGK